MIKAGTALSDPPRSPKTTDPIEPEPVTAQRPARGERQQSRHDLALAQLRNADPVLAVLIDAHPGFDPRAWLADLPSMDAFGALVFQVIGQQLSVSATRRILGRLQDLFDGQLPAPAQLLAAAPGDLQKAGLSRLKVTTLRSVAVQFANGTLREEDLRRLSDHDIEARLTTGNPND